MHADSGMTQPEIRWQPARSTTPDAPCFAMCSAALEGNARRGRGRSFVEGRCRTVRGSAEKREVGCRIAKRGSAWRFNRRVRRARLASGEAGSAPAHFFHGLT